MVLYFEDVYQIKTVVQETQKYTGILGKTWFFLNFLYRLGILLAISGGVFGGDEEGYVCSDKQTGCTRQCFDEFSKISLNKFWLLQFVVENAPSFFLYFITKNLNKNVMKANMLEEEFENKMIQAQEEEVDQFIIEAFSGLEKKIIKTRKRHGRVKTKQVLNANAKDKMKWKPLEVFWTNKIRAAVLFHFLVRLTIQIVFVHATFNIYGAQFQNKEYSLHNYAFMNVSELHKCGKYEEHRTEGVEFACYQQFYNGGRGYVPCHVSKARERTMALRYWNIGTLIAMSLTVIEILYFFFHQIRKYIVKRRPKTSFNNGSQQGEHIEMTNKFHEVNAYNDDDVNTYNNDVIDSCSDYSSDDDDVGMNSNLYRQAKMPGFSAMTDLSRL